MSHEIFYQQCQLTFLERKKKARNHFPEVKSSINRGMIENSPVSLLNLCTLLSPIKVREPEVLAGEVTLYTVCFQGHKWEQKMTGACRKHPVVSFTKC